jgi:hypothetical protein
LIARGDGSYGSDHGCPSSDRHSGVGDDDLNLSGDARVPTDGIVPAIVAIGVPSGGAAASSGQQADSALNGLARPARNPPVRLVGPVIGAKQPRS